MTDRDKSLERSEVSQVLGKDEETLFGFDSVDDDWVKLAHTAEKPDHLGGIGSYELVEEIDRGGQGVVYRARQPGTGRDIALKRLIAGSFSSRASRERFQREIEASSSLSHPGIVTIHGYEVVDGLPLMAMEWIDGIPINKWAHPKDGQPRSDKEIFHIFLDLCSAVHHAHQNGVLHRDLKPSNVLVSDDGRPHILDFGLAKSLAASGEVTISGPFAGTPAYASPEQFNAERLDIRSDVYSLGVMLYEMLTGQRPYHPEKGIPQFFDALERRDYPLPTSKRSGLSSEIDWVCGRALAADRMERYQSVDALAEDLRRHLAGEPVLAHPTSALYQLRKLIARNQRASALTALLFITVVAAGLFYRHTASVLSEQASELIAARDAEVAARDQAELARDAELAAREQADLARREVERQFDVMILAQQLQRSTLRFLSRDLLLAGDSTMNGSDTPLRVAVEHAIDSIPRRFQGNEIVGAYVQRALGKIQWRLGLHAESEATLRGAMAVANLMGADHSEARTATALAGLKCDIGELDEAQRLLNFALPIVELHREAQEEPYWETVHQIALLSLDQGDLAACEDAIENMLDCSLPYIESRPTRYRGALVDLGRLLLARGEHVAATEKLEEARLFHLEFTDEPDEVYGDLLLALAETKYALNEIEQALPFALEALEVYRSSILSDHPRAGEVLALLSVLTLELGGENAASISQTYASEALKIANAKAQPVTAARLRIRKRLAQLPN